MQIDKPRLLIEPSDPDRTLPALRDILANANVLYDRGVPVRLVFDQLERITIAQEMTADLLVLLAHEICRPYVRRLKDGNVIETDIRLNQWIAKTYLDMRGDWKLPALNGIASAPLLMNDGEIRSAEGYDADTGMYRENVPDLTGLVPRIPTREDAAAALALIRETFKTFPFADANIVTDPATGLDIVDTSKPPGRDESGLLVALLTAACRPSLRLAPGLLLRASPISGAGAGKGLLARCISIIAFGREPHAVTGGATAEELEKRIVAELIESGPVLFLDNLNNTDFRSNLLASAITERPSRVRILGKSQMVQLNAAAFVILTGNGLSIAEDLARRFIVVELDPRTENPEGRVFNTDIRSEVADRRTELLGAQLTIWRWGRLAQDIKPGLALGSFEQWCEWVRDPLLSLGCSDPVEKVSETKHRDSERQHIVELFGVWRQHHGDTPTTAHNLDDEVKHLIDPQGRSRQFLVASLERLVGTRMAGFVLTRQAAPGDWGTATFALQQSGEGKSSHRSHRSHRDHETDDRPWSVSDAPDAQQTHTSANNNAVEHKETMPPMPPMPSTTSNRSISPGSSRHAERGSSRRCAYCNKPVRPSRSVRLDNPDGPGTMRLHPPCEELWNRENLGSA